MENKEIGYFWEKKLFLKYISLFNGELLLIIVIFFIVSRNNYDMDCEIGREIWCMGEYFLLGDLVGGYGNIIKVIFGRGSKGCFLLSNGFVKNCYFVK